MPLFEEILDEEKDAKGVELDTELDADDLKRIAALYKARVEKELGKPFPEDVQEQLWGAIGAVFGSLAQPARQHLSQAEQYSRGLGHGGDRAGHGVRQSRRDLGHRRRLHPRSGDRRKAALWRIPGQCPGRGCGGGHPHAAADLQDRARAPGRQEGLDGRGDAQGLCRTGGHRRTAGTALPRHAGRGIHGAGRQALHAADPHRQAHRRSGAEDRRGHGARRADRQEARRHPGRAGSARPAAASHARSRCAARNRSPWGWAPRRGRPPAKSPSPPRRPRSWPPRTAT